MMKCPYTIGLTKAVIQYKYDADGYEVQRIMYETKEFIDCRGAECAVWQDGKCQYKGALV
jgi:hypothetical protein